ncbi:S-formylglutathione hydrolase [Ferrovibrio sp.]|uniref:S-formylglutathione hydrolase n=1 Tax=Ferrovibrio sp. TaxID=1917215 RepID=UPI000CBACA93|nr:S-formylglutathione hydrolase [Ferrovibrio sp.]PJI42038.1 MAG: S-formylglutathione hydrolase [Ferrovibrio sp.]
MERIKKWACFGGQQQVWKHRSSVLGCSMEVAVYLPPQASENAKLPVLYYLSGLTCTWENMVSKAGAQRYAAEHGLILVAPDTSPRGVNIAGEDDAYDFGSGAGFYVDATEAPWSKHYRMYSYVTEELPALIAEHFPVEPSRSGIFGHSMGGHGALICAFRKPQLYKSVSAFAPIVAPSQVPWGEKAFTGYLGADRSTWKAWEATALASGTEWRRPVLIDQGMADEFLEKQLKPQLLANAAAAAGIPLTLRLQAGYDHSYYFIASFIGEHIAHHAQQLRR